MTLILTDEQKAQLSIQPVTAAGNPARVDGVPVWTVSDDTVATVEVSEDGLSAWVVSTGKLGTTQVAVTIDADLGEGVRAVAATLDLQVIAAEAVSVTISAGTPVLK
jgi:hypothetical protein